MAKGGGAVLSCPAYFNDSQKEAMIGAGQRGGLTILDTIPEPVVRKCVRQ